MIILSHRGYWKAEEEKNSQVAFDRTIAHSFGTETDIRDCMGSLVVAHDPPSGGEIELSALIRLFKGTGLTLAINVKSDGLAPLLKQVLDPEDVSWFAFDMSGPETIRYVSLGLPVFTRHSDIEPSPICYQEAEGVWLDAFRTDWFDEEVVRAHLANGKKVCIVSPELHRRVPDQVWSWLRSSGLNLCPDLFLCTDLPEQASEFMQVNK